MRNNQHILKGWTMTGGRWRPSSSACCSWAVRDSLPTCCLGRSETDPVRFSIHPSIQKFSYHHDHCSVYAPVSDIAGPSFRLRRRHSSAASDTTDVSSSAIRFWT
ncbi:uncharacterized protein LOC144135287 [Amblyomma americanum]